MGKYITDYEYPTKTLGDKNTCGSCGKKESGLWERIGGSREEILERGKKVIKVLTTTVFYACRACAKRCNLDSDDNCGHERSCDCDDIKKKA